MSQPNDVGELQLTRSKRKQISFFASVLIVIGSCIGAGIFFKSHDVLGFSGGNVIFSTIIWTIAAFSVLTLALALIEVSSACHDNLSLIGWCKKFNHNIIYKGCKFYMVYIYLPHMYFGMPVYAIMPFLDALKGFGVKQTGFGTNVDWVIWMIIVLAIALYFIFTSGLYSRVGNIQNMVCQVGKFLPIFIIIGIAIAILVSTKQVHNTSFHVDQVTDRHGNVNMMFNLTPFLGIFGSLAAIFFAYDGFYEAAGVRSEMREPNRVPHSFIWGISIVTILYVVLTLLMSLASDGGNFSGTDVGSFNTWMKNNHLGWLYGVVSLLICLGVLGILNNFTMWAPRYIEDLINEGEVYVSRRFLDKLNPHHPKVGNTFLLILVLPVVIVLSIVGALAYFTTAQRINDYGMYFGRFASLADLIGSWTALFNFVFIALAVIGAIKNRRTNKVKVERYKYFVGLGWFSSIMILGSLIISALQPFIDLGIITGYYHGWRNTMASNQSQQAIGLLLTCILLFVFLFGSFGFIPLEKRIVLRRQNEIQRLLDLFKQEEEFTKLNSLVKNVNNKKQLKQILVDNNYSLNQIRHLIKGNEFTNLYLIKKELKRELVLVNKIADSFNKN